MTRSTQLSCLLALAVAVGCGETQNPEETQRTFDRPVDVAFACYGNLRITNGGTTGEAVEVSAMPARACEIRSQGAKDQPVPLGQEGLTGVNWYGLILQSGPGTVAITEFTTKRDAGDDVVVQDAAPFVPGKNSISVGEEPVAIHTDAAGCHAITANAGSCDLSVLDLNSALDGIGVAGTAADPAVRVDRLEVRNASGAPIRSRPAAMVGEPSSDLIGAQCPASPRGLVYVAYPSCHLVAAVDTSTGTIVSGVQFDAAGMPTIVGGDVTCPDECGGATAPPGVRPVALDLEVDPRTASRRLVIGADNSASITVAELDPTWRPSLLFQVALEDQAGDLGVTALALSREIGMGGTPRIEPDDAGTNRKVIDDDGPAGQFQFVYAVATDGTVRVADVLDERRECDTQVDPRFAREISSVRDLSCLPIGTLMTPRRAGARSPGIHLPGEAIPLSVELFLQGNIDPNLLESPATLLGDFAVITMSNGAVFMVNVDDDNYPDAFNPTAPLAVPVQLAMAHQLRDVVGQRHLTIDTEDEAFNPSPGEGQSDNSGDDKSCDYSGKFDQLGDAIGGPRSPAPATRSVPAGSVSANKLDLLPGVRQILCDRRTLHGDKATPEDYKAISELAYAAPVDVRDRAFPDLMALAGNETWTLLWEGSLSLNTGSSDIDGAAIREGMLRSSSLGLHVLDAGKPFCEAGVEPFDILKLHGCDASLGAAHCPSGYTCFVHPDSKIQNFGSCMLADEADRLADACRDFLISVRRYTIKTTASGELVAVARRHELRTTPLDGCVSDQQCEDLAVQVERAASNLNPLQLPARPASCGTGGCEADKGETATTCPQDCGPLTWACVADPERAPMGGTGKRCELRCDDDSDCVDGTVCSGGFCMEGVVPSQSCLNATQRYELRAGEAFSVIGSQSGFVHPIVEDAAGTCVRDPAASRLSIGRLPLVPKDRLAPNTLHACDPAADPLTGQRADGTFEPNPCLTTVSHFDEPRYVLQVDQSTGAESCLELKAEDHPAPVEYQVPAVQFRNRGLTMTLVDPYYPGDARCIGDRAGNLGQIPHVVPGMTLSLRQIGGFVSMRALTGISLLENLPSFPVKVVRGPSQSLWVLDEGDFLSSSSGQASTRGKVVIFRPESTSAGLTIK